MKKPINFSKKKKSFVKRILSSGLNISGFILLSLKELGYLTFDAFLPRNYPEAKFWREVFGLDPEKEKWEKATVRTNIYRLKKQGFIDCDSKKKTFFLTKRGEKFTTYIRERYSILKKAWDGEIRIVIFDIPEKKRNYRDWLRQELYLLGFKLFQKSVFIGKYPLPKDLIEEIDDYDLASYVFIFTIKETSKKEELFKFLE